VNITQAQLEQIIKEELKESLMDRIGQAMTKPRFFSGRSGPSREEQAEEIVNNTLEALSTALDDMPSDLNGKVNTLQQMKELLSRALTWGIQGDINMSLSKLISDISEK
jgi:hypothetical protein